MKLVSERLSLHFASNSFKTCEDVSVSKGLATQCEDPSSDPWHWLNSWSGKFVSLYLAGKGEVRWGTWWGMRVHWLVTLAGQWFPVFVRDPVLKNPIGDSRGSHQALISDMHLHGYTLAHKHTGPCTRPSHTLTHTKKNILKMILLSTKYRI